MELHGVITIIVRNKLRVISGRKMCVGAQRFAVTCVMYMSNELKRRFVLSFCAVLNYTVNLSDTLPHHLRAWRERGGTFCIVVV